MSHLENERDEFLWKLAAKRVKFKNHFIKYISVNLLFWIVWYFIDAQNERHGLPWPIFPTIGWGIGIVVHYVSVYHKTDNSGRIEREYQRLKKKEKQD